MVELMVKEGGTNVETIHPHVERSRVLISLSL